MSEKDVIKETRPRMEGAVEDLRKKLASVRTGRAAVSLLDPVTVDYYGTPTPLSQMASVHAPEPTLLTVQPWDQSQLGAIEKAIRSSDLGLNPTNDGKMVRVPVPPLTEERRKPIRNVRRDANDRLKKMLKDKAISEDAERDALDEVQKMTNTYVGRVDELARTKEQEILSV